MEVRKKPVVVDALRFTGTKENYADMLVFCPIAGILPGFLLIKTREGTHRAEIGDWVIKGVKGEFYPCKPDIFAQTYEVLARPVVCMCLIELGRSGYVEPNLLCNGQFFLYPTKGAKADRKALLLNYCPVCGLKIPIKKEATTR